MTLRQLHERIAATQPAHWRTLPLGPGFGGTSGAVAPPATRAADGSSAGPPPTVAAGAPGPAPAAEYGPAAGSGPAAGTGRAAESAPAPGTGRAAATGPGVPPATPNASDAGHVHRAVLRADVDLVLTWGMRESSRDYFEPWLGNLGRMSEVRCDRVLLDVLWRGSLVDRLVGLAFRDFLLPFPRSRAPRVKGLPDRFFAREETPAWRLAHELTFPDGVAFERVGHRSGLRVE